MCFVACDLLCAAGVFQQPEDIGVGKQRECPLIKPRHLGSKHKRGAEDAPECHHCALFILGKICVPGMFVRVEALPEPAERQHVAVREASLGHMVLPELTALEHI